MEQKKSPRLSKRLSLFFKNLVKQGDKCNLCNKKFHLFRNKHMCSRCHNAICSSCSKDRGKNRVCNQCKGVFVKLRAQSFISKNPSAMSQVKNQQQNGNAEESKSLNVPYEAQEQNEDDEGNFGIDQKLAAKLGFNQAQVENVDMFSDYSTLPAELRTLIENSGIEKNDALENPAAAFGAVLFAMQSLPSQQIVQQITQYVVNFQNENPETRYQLVKVIGKGSQGTVYVGIKKDTGKEYALKRMIPKNEQAEKDMINEIEIMMICNHDNIVNCYETFYFNEAY